MGATKWSTAATRVRRSAPDRLRGGNETSRRVTSGPRSTIVRMNQSGWPSSIASSCAVGLLDVSIEHTEGAQHGALDPSPPGRGRWRARTAAAPPRRSSPSSNASRARSTCVSTRSRPARRAALSSPGRTAAPGQRLDAEQLHPASGSGSRLEPAQQRRGKRFATETSGQLGVLEDDRALHGHAAARLRAARFVSTEPVAPRSPPRRARDASRPSPCRHRSVPVRASRAPAISRLADGTRDLLGRGQLAVDGGDERGHPPAS